jgi:hypothetical protein
MSPSDYISTCEQLKRYLVTIQDQDMTSWTKEAAIRVVLILPSWGSSLSLQSLKKESHKIDEMAFSR